jgi:galactose mutarotase-like enzyme
VYSSGSSPSRTDLPDLADTAPSLSREPFGTTPDGEAVERVTLGNGTGIQLSAISYGAAVQELWAPDRDGRRANIVLGFADIDGYASEPSHYFGAIIGRFANRIGGGRYTLTASSLRIDLTATTDRPTIVNLTDHPLWNLAGEGQGTIHDHHVTVRARRYTSIDEALLPTGEVAPVTETPFDFTSAAALGARIDDDFDQLRIARGYDHNFVIDRVGGRSIIPVAWVEEHRSGRTLEIQTTEPGLQLYSGNLLDGSLVGTSGRAYPQHAGLALETQHFPDSPHHESFPTTVLRPGRTFRSTTIYRLAVTR